ncbi:MAG: hypothetical protein QM610_13730 [Chitinophagaceae bacterium]
MNAESLKLKYSLLDKLVSIKDEKLLKKINALIGDVNLDNSLFRVSQKQKMMLKDSEMDIKHGFTITDEALNAEEDAWLNE